MKKIIGFFGCDSQTGSTMVAQATAEVLAKKGKRVLFISGSGNYGDDFFKNKEGKSLDNIKVQLINKDLETFDLEQIIVEAFDILIIPGIRNAYGAGHYPETSMETVVNACEDKYDYIIIDGGSNLNLGLTISALKISQDRYFVITQQEKSLRRFLHAREKVLNTLDVKGTLVINKHIKNLALYTPKELMERLGFNKSINVPYIETGWQAEIKHKTLLNYPKFEKGIEQIVGTILGEEIDKKWIKNFLWKPT